MSKQVSLQNTRPGGFGLPTGQVIPGNGSITVEPEVWAYCKDHPVVAANVEAGHLVVDGKGEKKPEPADDLDENGDTPEMAELRRMFDASYQQQGDALAAAQSEVTSLTGRVTELQNAVAAKDGEIASLKAGSASEPLKAEHHGGGKFNVTQGESTLLSGLTKADADAFNAMDDAAKAAFITERKG